MPRIVIDNTSPQFVFDDSSKLSDGVAQLFNSLVRTPVDLANIRQQQESAAAARNFQQQQWQHTLDQDQANQQWRQQQGDWHQQAADRQWTNDLLGQAWHEADFDRAKANDAAAQELHDREQKRLEGEASRRWAEDAGTAALNIGKVFGLGQPAGNMRNAGTGWHQSQDGRYFRTSADGVLEVWDPETKQVQRMTGAPGAGGPPGQTVQLQQPPQPLNEGFSLSPRRSGYSGVHSLGDVLGGISNLWQDEQPMGAPAAGAPPAAAPDPRSFAPQSGDPSLAPRAAAPKLVDQATLQAYAQKHRIDLASAANFLTQQGFTVQAPAR
jgi:hypothetical protein